MKKRWHMFWFTGIVAAIVACLLLARQHRSIAPTITPAALAPAPSVPAKIPAPAAAPTASTAAATEVTPRKIAQNKAKAYSAARDLAAYIDSLQTDGSSEDEILTAKAKAMEECWMLSLRPNYAAEAIESRARIAQENSTQFRQDIETLSQRCSALISQGQVSLENLKANYAKAARDGNAEAMAYQLSHAVFHDANSDERPPTTATSPSFDPRQKILDILASGDPEAIFLLSGLFNENSHFSGKATGSAIAEAAWQLAACDFGLDCSENSYLLRQYCINAGAYCEPGDLRWHIRELALSPVAYQRAVALEAEIYAAIQSGNAASLF